MEEIGIKKQKKKNAETYAAVTRLQLAAKEG
jgi:hypothetical protein